MQIFKDQENSFVYVFNGQKINKPCLNWQTIGISNEILKFFYRNLIFYFFRWTRSPGERGPAGPQGPKGIQGESGEVGVTYIRWGKKTCPNSGATLVYEGNIKTVHSVKRIASQRNRTVVFTAEQVPQ